MKSVIVYLSMCTFTLAEKGRYCTRIWIVDVLALLMMFASLADAQRLSSVELALIDHLMSSYDVSSRPVVNSSDVVDVEVGAGLYAIAGLVSW